VNKKALLIALVAAVAGLVLLQLYMRRFEQEVTGGDPVDIVLARKDIPAGAVVTAAHISEYRVPERYVSGRNVLANDLRHVIGTRVSTTVRANEPLLWTDIARMREDRSLANLVQPGMVAASVSGQTFNGLLGPGDRVDVILLAGGRNGLTADDGKIVRAVTLLQSALVLAVGGSISRDKSSSGGLTLLLSPEQAQLLLVARNEGTLQLVLRNPDDLTVRETVTAVTTDDVKDPKRRANFRQAHGAHDSEKGARSAE
jgi:pilus assembly protein CpaB